MRPLIFLSFANQKDDYLATLKRESQNINDALKGLHDQNAIEVYREESVEIRLLLDGINRFRERITIFHYAGHAGDTALQFEDGNANAKGLAQLLGALPNLQLVVLNGCSTQGQVDYLLQQGVKAVIATSSPINDTKATEFATEFYSSLAKHHTVEIAFKFAVNALTTKYGGEDMATIIQFRGFGAKPEAKSFPWGLYLNKDISKDLLDWKLPSATKTPIEENIQIENSEKVVVNSNLEAAGNIHIGDQYITQIIQGKERKIKRILSGLPYNEVFEGREEDLQKVEALLTQNKSLNIVGINGIGGIGKSSVAKQLFLKLHDNYDFCLFLEGKENLVNTFDNEALINNLDLVNEIKRIPLNDDKRAERITELLTNALLNLDGTKLLLIDNTPDDIDSLKPLLNQKWHILTTSRVAKDNIKSYELHQASLNDAVRIFAVYFDLDANYLTEQEKAYIENIVQRLACHILAIELVAKNAKYLGWTLDKTITQLQTKGLDIAKYADTSTTHSQEKITNTFTYLLDIFPLENLEEQERYLLTQYSVIPAISITADTWALLLDEDTEIWQHYSRQLHKKGWLTIESDEKEGFLLHALLAEVIRTKKADSLLEECRVLINSLEIGLNEDIRHIDNYRQASLFAHLGLNFINTIPFLDYDLVILSQNIGYYHKDTGNLSLMLQAFQKMSDIQNALCTREPNNPRFKSRLAISYELLGYTQHLLGNLDEALPFLERYNQLNEELYSADPNNPEFKNGLAVSYEKLGNINITLNDLDKALDFFEKYNQLKKELYSADPNNADLKNGLAISHEKLGLVYSSLGNLEKALSFFEYEAKLFEELYADFPENVKFKNGLAISYSKLGDTYNELGNLDKALSFFENQTELFRELYVAYPNNVNFKNGLAVSYSLLGSFHQDKLENNTLAREYFEKCYTLWNELVISSPNSVEYQNNLKWVESKLAEL